MLLAFIKKVFSKITLHTNNNTYYNSVGCSLNHLRTLVHAISLLEINSSIIKKNIIFFLIVAYFISILDWEKKTRTDHSEYRIGFVPPLNLKSATPFCEAYRVKKLNSFSLKKQFLYNNIVSIHWPYSFSCYTELLANSRFFMNNLIKFKDVTLTHLFSWLPLIFFWTKTIVTQITLAILPKVARPLRIATRLLIMLGVIIQGLLILLLSDTKLALKQIPSILFLYELFFRLELWVVILVILVDKNVYADINSIFESITCTSIISNDLISSFTMLVLIIQYASLYYSASARKHLLYSTHYLIIFIMSVLIFALPEYHITNTILFDSFFIFYSFLFLFRALREDTKTHNYFLIQSSYKISWSHYTVFFDKFDSILYRSRGRYSNTAIEMVSLVLWFYLVFVLYNDSSNFNILENLLPNLPVTVVVAITSFFFLRQPAYPILLYLFICTTVLALSILTIIVISPTGWSYGGLIFQNSINETTFLGNTGLISTIRGLESQLISSLTSNFNYYFGEVLTNRISNYTGLQLFDIITFSTTGQQFWGDSYIQPYLFTPNDDHNWKIMTTLENYVSNNIKQIQSVSESNQSDTTRYWPIERNLHIWFGEFLEKDSYYGWSHTYLIDTESYFDYSPYSLSNILGDSLMRMVLTDVLTIFQGPTELDSEPNSGLNEWGSNYVPGSTTNKVSGSFTGSSENSYTKDSSQRSRNNSELYHEWFPGLFVLDGRFDSRHQAQYLLLVLSVIIPFCSLSAWNVINDKPSIGLDDYFTASSMYNYNFYFFGNAQSDTLTTFYWSPVFSASYEWPTDKIKHDHIAYSANSDLFSEILSYLNTGQFSTTDLDGLLHIPILKHTEGYTSTDYKDFVMPILFPVANSKTYGNDEFINLAGDQNLDSKFLVNEYSPSFHIEVNTENLNNNAISSMVIANEVNLEYSTLFDGLLNELEDIESSRGRGYHYEFEEHISDESTKSSLYDPSANYAETGVYEFDTVIDEPKTFEDTDFTVYDSELESFLTEEEINVNDLAALETMYPGSAHLYDKKEFVSDKDWTVGIGKPMIDSEKAQYSALPDLNTTNLSYEDWYRIKNTNPTKVSTAKGPEKSIYYIGFKNSIYMKKLRKKIRNRLGLLILHADLRKTSYYGKALVHNMKQSLSFAYRRNMIFNYTRTNLVVKVQNTKPANTSLLSTIVTNGVPLSTLPGRLRAGVLNTSIIPTFKISRNFLLEVGAYTNISFKLLKPDRYIRGTNDIFTLRRQTPQISLKSNRITTHNLLISNRPVCGKLIKNSLKTPLKLVALIASNYSNKNSSIATSRIYSILATRLGNDNLLNKYNYLSKIAVRGQQKNVVCLLEKLILNSRLLHKPSTINILTLRVAAPPQNYKPLRAIVDLFLIVTSLFTVTDSTKNLLSTLPHKYYPHKHLYRVLSTNRIPNLKINNLSLYTYSNCKALLRKCQNSPKFHLICSSRNLAVPSTSRLVEVSKINKFFSFSTSSSRTQFVSAQTGYPKASRTVNYLKFNFTPYWISLLGCLIYRAGTELSQTTENAASSALVSLAIITHNTLFRTLTSIKHTAVVTKSVLYKILFQQVYKLSMLITNVGPIFSTPLHNLLIQLKKSLVFSSTNDYLNSLINSSSLNIRLQPPFNRKIIIKSLWIEHTAAAIEITMGDFTGAGFAISYSIKKIARANRIYRSIIALIYQLDKFIKLLSQKIIAKTSDNYNYKNRDGYFKFSVKLFETAVLDIMNITSLLRQKPSIILVSCLKLSVEKNIKQKKRIIMDNNIGPIRSALPLRVKRVVVRAVIGSVNSVSTLSRKLNMFVNVNVGRLTTTYTNRTYIRYRIAPSISRRVKKYWDNIQNNHRIFRILKKKKFQDLPYNKIIQVDQFDKEYQNTLRTGEPYPTNNYSKTKLMEFYRVYGYVLFRAMVSQEISKDSWYHRRHEISTTSYRSYHHLPTLSDIIFETTLDYRTRRLLSEMYHKYIYRKSTFILVPRSVDKLPGSLDRVYYYFYRDITESIFPYFRLRLERYRNHPSLFEGFGNEISNFYSLERKKNSENIGEASLRIKNAKFYPIYWFYFDPDKVNGELAYNRSVSHSVLNLKYVNSIRDNTNYTYLASYGNMRASSMLNMAWYLNRVLNSNTLQREEFELILEGDDNLIPNSFIKPGMFIGWKPRYIPTKNIKPDLEAREFAKLGDTMKLKPTTRIFNMFRAVNLIKKVGRLFRIMGQQNRFILWEYWQKQLFVDSYLSQGVYHVIKRKIPLILSANLLNFTHNQTRSGVLSGLPSLVLSLKSVFKRDNEAIWFNNFFSKIEIWFKRDNIDKRKKLNLLGPSAVTNYIDTLIRLRRHWLIYRSQSWKISNLSDDISLGKETNSNSGRLKSLSKYNVLSLLHFIKKKPRKKKNRKNLLAISSDGVSSSKHHSVSKNSKTNSNESPFEWHASSSVNYYSSTFFNSYIIKKSFYLLKLGFLRPNSNNASNIGWAFSILRRANKIAELCISGKTHNKDKCRDQISFFKWLSSRIVTQKKQTNKKISSSVVLLKIWNYFRITRRGNYPGSNTNRIYYKAILTKLHSILPINQLADITRSIIYGEKKNYRPFLNLPIFDFIDCPNNTTDPIISYNYDQTKNFFISQLNAELFNRKIRLSKVVSSSVYGWIDKTTIRWSLYRVLLSNYRFSIRKSMYMPYSDIMPIVSSDTMILLVNIQPITYEDCKYYREYTEMFLVKLTRLFIRKNSSWAGKVGINTFRRSSRLLRRKTEITNSRRLVMKKKRCSHTPIKLLTNLPRLGVQKGRSTNLQLKRVVKHRYKKKIAIKTPLLLLKRIFCHLKWVRKWQFHVNHRFLSCKQLKGRRYRYGLLNISQKYVNSTTDLVDIPNKTNKYRITFNSTNVCTEYITKVLLESIFFIMEIDPYRTPKIIYSFENIISNLKNSNVILVPEVHNKTIFYFKLLWWLVSVQYKVRRFKRAVLWSFFTPLDNKNLFELRLNSKLFFKNNYMYSPVNIKCKLFKLFSNSANCSGLYSFSGNETVIGIGKNIQSTFNRETVILTTNSLTALDSFKINELLESTKSSSKTNSTYFVCNNTMPPLIKYRIIRRLKRVERRGFRKAWHAIYYMALNLENFWGELCEIENYYLQCKSLYNKKAVTDFYNTKYWSNRANAETMLSEWGVHLSKVSNCNHTKKIHFIYPPHCENINNFMSTLDSALINYVIQNCRNFNKPTTVFHNVIRNNKNTNENKVINFAEIELKPFICSWYLEQSRFIKRRTWVYTLLVRTSCKKKITNYTEIESVTFDGIWHRSLLIFKKKIIPIVTNIKRKLLHSQLSTYSKLNREYCLAKNNKAYRSSNDSTIIPKNNSADSLCRLTHIEIRKTYQLAIKVVTDHLSPMQSLVNSDKYILSYIITKRTAKSLTADKVFRSVKFPSHLSNSYLFPLILSYRHYVDIFELTAGPLSTIRKGWTAIARVTWYGNQAGSAEILRIKSITTDYRNNKRIKSIEYKPHPYKSNKLNALVKYAFQNIKIKYRNVMKYRYNKSVCVVTETIDTVCLSSTILNRYSQGILDASTKTKTTLNKLLIKPIKRIIYIVTNFCYTNTHYGIERYATNKYALLYFTAVAYFQIPSYIGVKKSAFSSSSTNYGTPYNLEEVLTTYTITNHFAEIIKDMYHNTTYKNIIKNNYVRNTDLFPLTHLSTTAQSLLKRKVKVCKISNIPYRTNRLFLSCTSVEDLLKIVNPKYLSRYHWVYDVSFGCTRWGNAFSQVMWFELMLASIYNDYPIRMQRLRSTLRSLAKKVTDSAEVDSKPRHSDSFRRFGNFRNQNKPISDKLNSWTEFDNDLLVGDNIREDDYYAEWSDSSATSDWSRISQYKIVEDAISFIDDEGIFILDSSANYSSELTDVTHSNDFSRSDTSNDGQIHDIFRKPHIGISSYYSDLGTSQIEREDVTIKLRTLNFERLYQNSRINRSRNSLLPFFKHTPLYESTTTSDTEKPRKLRFWLKKSKSPHIDIYHAYGLSTHGESSRSYTDTTQSEDKNQNEVLGGSRKWTSHNGDQDEVVGWFESARDIPVSGHGIRGGSRNRRSERGWFSERWNFGFTSSTSNIGENNNTTDTDVDNRFWDYYDEADSGPFYQEYMREILPDRSTADDSVFSNKINTEVNRLSEDLAYANESYKAIFKYFPQFKTGNWSNSDSGQTSWGFNSLVSDSEVITSKKTYNPIWGVYFIDVTRLKKDISDYGYTYVNPFNPTGTVDAISNFVSDVDTFFFDDKVINIVNPWFSWLEFIRHTLISRWRVELNYTKSENRTAYSYPMPLIHEFYFFKYLAYSRFIRKILRYEISLENSKNNSIQLPQTIPTKLLIKFVFLQVNGNELQNRNKKKSRKKSKIRLSRCVQWLRYNINSRWGLTRDSYYFEDFNSDKQLEMYDRFNYIGVSQVTDTSSSGHMVPTPEASTWAVPVDILIFSRNIGHFRKKPTSGLYTYNKPYRNVETTTPYEASLFSFDPYNPQRLHQHFAHHRDDIHVELANYSSEASEIVSGSDYDAGGGGELSLTNDPIDDESEELYSLVDGEYVDKLPATRRNTVVSIPEVNPEQTAILFGNYSNNNTGARKLLVENESDHMQYSYDEAFISKQFKGLSPSVGVRSGLELKNTYRKYRRKDSHLKYTRGWFISNHIQQFNDFTSTYSPTWALISDFDVDRKRSRGRNNKHGSEYRLNFNTELWWTRHEKPDLSIRRVDGLEFDDYLGALDSDGEIGHLHKGIDNVMHLPELIDVNETTLPLFEKSLVDPESPALNEDGDFPEYDLNIIYTTADVANIKLFELKKKYLSTGLQDQKKLDSIGGKTNISRKESPTIPSIYDKWNYSMSKLYNSKVSLNASIKVDELYSINRDVEMLTNLHISRKENFSFGSALSNLNNITNDHDLLRSWDIGDMVDAMSSKDPHPIASAAEQIFDTLIDEKIDEAIEFYFFTGTEYSSLFYNTRRVQCSDRADWYAIDFISEVINSQLENIPGFSYDLILHKYGAPYWRVILEADSSWDDNYSASFPQVHDRVEGDGEYLPIWSYDPSIWERPGLKYSLTPLTSFDDSKVLVNTRVSLFDPQYKLLESKDLTGGGVLGSSLSWSASDIVGGLSDWLPYDIMYASDDDSDVDLLVDALYNTEGEEEFSPRGTSSFWSRTTETDSDEYPALGIKRNIISNENFEPTNSDDLIIETEVQVSMSTENLSAVPKDEVYADSAPNSSSETEMTTDRYVSTEGHELLDSRKLDNRNEDIDSNGESVINVGNLDSSEANDVADTKLVNNLNTQRRSTFINDLAPAYGDLDIASESPADESNNLKLKSLSDAKSDLKENRELLVASSLMGKRSHPQYDIGGEVGYKSGLFESRFWYDIYSYLNSTTQDQWSNTSLPQIVDSKWRTTSTIIDVQRDTGVHRRKENLLSVMAKKSKSLNRLIGNTWYPISVSNKNNRNNLLRVLLSKEVGARLRLITKYTLSLKNKSEYKTKNTKILNKINIEQPPIALLNKIGSTSTYLQTGSINYSLRSNIIKYGFMSSNWNQLSYEYINWCYQYSRPLKPYSEIGYQNPFDQFIPNSNYFLDNVLKFRSSNFEHGEVQKSNWYQVHNSFVLWSTNSNACNSAYQKLTYITRIQRTNEVEIPTYVYSRLWTVDYLSIRRGLLSLPLYNLQKSVTLSYLKRVDMLFNTDKSINISNSISQNLTHTWFLINKKFDKINTNANLDWELGKWQPQIYNKFSHLNKIKTTSIHTAINYLNKNTINSNITAVMLEIVNRKYISRAVKSSIRANKTKIISYDFTTSRYKNYRLSIYNEMPDRLLIDSNLLRQYYITNTHTTGTEILSVNRQISLQKNTRHLIQKNTNPLKNSQQEKYVKQLFHNNWKNSFNILETGELHTDSVVRRKLTNLMLSNKIRGITNTWIKNKFIKSGSNTNLYLSECFDYYGNFYNLTFINESTNILSHIFTDNISGMSLKGNLGVGNLTRSRQSQVNKCSMYYKYYKKNAQAYVLFHKLYQSNKPHPSWLRRDPTTQKITCKTAGQLPNSTFSQRVKKNINNILRMPILTYKRNNLKRINWSVNMSNPGTKKFTSYHVERKSKFYSKARLALTYRGRDWVAWHYLNKKCNRIFSLDPVELITKNNALIPGYFTNNLSYDRVCVKQHSNVLTINNIKWSESLQIDTKIWTEYNYKSDLATYDNEYLLSYNIRSLVLEMKNIREHSVRLNNYLLTSLSWLNFKDIFLDNQNDENVKLKNLKLNDEETRQLLLIFADFAAKDMLDHYNYWPGYISDQYDWNWHTYANKQRLFFGLNRLFNILKVIDARYLTKGKEGEYWYIASLENALYRTAMANVAIPNKQYKRLIFLKSIHIKNIFIYKTRKYDIIASSKKKKQSNQVIETVPYYTIIDITVMRRLTDLMLKNGRQKLNKKLSLESEHSHTKYSHRPIMFSKLDGIMIKIKNLENNRYSRKVFMGNIKQNRLINHDNMLHKFWSDEIITNYPVNVPWEVTQLSYKSFGPLYKCSNTKWVERLVYVGSKMRLDYIGLDVDQGKDLNKLAYWFYTKEEFLADLDWLVSAVDYLTLPDLRLYNGITLRLMQRCYYGIEYAIEGSNRFIDLVDRERVRTNSSIGLFHRNNVSPEFLTSYLSYFCLQSNNRAKIKFNRSTISLMRSDSVISRGWVRTIKNSNCVFSSIPVNGYFPFGSIESTRNVFNIRKYGNNNSVFNANKFYSGLKYTTIGKQDFNLDNYKHFWIPNGRNVAKKIKYRPNYQIPIALKLNEISTKPIMRSSTNSHIHDILRRLLVSSYSRNITKSRELLSGSVSSYSRAWNINSVVINSKIRLATVDNQKSDFQIGAKIGDIDDSSYWSSATEYLNEQYLFDTKIFNQDYVMYGYSEIDENNNNYQRNKTRLAWSSKRNEKFYTEPSAISEGSGGSFETDEDTSDDEDQHKYYTFTELSREYRNIYAEISDGSAGVENSYNDVFDVDNDHQLFSYIDWGFDSDVINNIGTTERFDKGGDFTADLIRDPSTESLYLDYVENEYAEQLRAFPEEVLDWTISDYYSEMLYNNEISDLPNSTNESEQYSIDSSNSISDYFVEIEGTDREVEDSTMYISDDPSSEYTSVESTTESSDFLNLNGELALADQLERNVSPNAHPEVDIANIPTSFFQINRSSFSDYENSAVFESNINQTSTSRFDSSKMELEDNTREPISYMVESKYYNSFFLESTLDAILIDINANREWGLKTHFYQYVSNKLKGGIQLRQALFSKTDYLRVYRALMVDVGLSNYMY